MEALDGTNKGIAMKY